MCGDIVVQNAMGSSISPPHRQFPEIPDRPWDRNPVSFELANRISGMPGDAQEQVQGWLESPDQVMELLQTVREAKSWEDFKRGRIHPTPFRTEVPNLAPVEIDHMAACPSRYATFTDVVAELKGGHTVSGNCGRGCGGHPPAERPKRGNGRKSKTRRRTGHAYGARNGDGQRYFFTAWGLPGAKCT